MATSCTWPIDRSCYTTPSDPDDEIAELRRIGAESLAVAILHALSGRQFGVCTVILRPCGAPDVLPLAGSGYAVGYGRHLELVEGAYASIGCGCVGRCVQNGPRVLHLPGPAVSIDEVTIAGEVLDEADYALEANRLYRRSAPWPSQRLDRPLGDAGTWSVKYQRGVPVPDGVDILTGKLAAEFLAACTGGKCKLPRRVRSVSRNGISYDMVDPTDIYTTGKTGIPEIDLWLSAVNPHRLVQPAKVL